MPFEYGLGLIMFNKDKLKCILLRKSVYLFSELCNVVLEFFRRDISAFIIIIIII